MKAYKNNGATHTMRDGVEVPRGGIIKCDENLAKAFPHKFEEVSGNQKVKDKENTSTAKQKEAAEERPNTKKKSDEMIDVTDKFTVPEGYTVKRDKRGCWVYDGDEEPANEKPLKRDEVEAFIKECAR